MVPGSIDGTPPSGISKQRPTEELIRLLDDKTHRVAAATELCDRADARAAAPVIAAAKKMSRAEAVRILGKSVKFGSAAAAPLIEGLSSSKAFLRHGCALALALLRTDEGTHAVIDLLLTEPTEIWREIARAIGQIGPSALMPLASHVGRLGEVTPSTAERVAWAMAHVGVRGGKAALDQMANGQSIMAPIAQKALELHANAARDEVRVRPGEPSKDVTVNRAFSRRFFEALEADRPDVAQAALHDLDASGPLELDDSDLLVEDDEEEAELDESDLIQT
jgi:HEAT repeat protein